MGRPGRPVLTWADLTKGQQVHFYSGDGWKKAHVSHPSQISCSVVWQQGAKTRTTRVYDLRNIQHADAG